MTVGTCPAGQIHLYILAIHSWQILIILHFGRDDFDWIAGADREGVAGALPIPVAILVACILFAEVLDERSEKAADSAF